MENKESEISTQTLSKWLTENKPVYILDVRPKSEREEWSIPGSIHADIYDKLKSNDPEAFNTLALPENTPIVIVCAGGKTSLIAAEKLKQKGIAVLSLQGGMKAWNYAWNNAEINFPGKDTKIIQVRRSAKGCLSYIVGSANEGIVVDASLDPSIYIDLAKINNWKIKYAMDTHIHADYISRTRELANECGAKHLFIDQATVNYPFIKVKDNDIIPFGNTSFQIIHTPGHTCESTSYKIGEAAILTGDTLFVDGVGRPDLKANQEEAVLKAKLLYQSLKQLLSNSPKMIVLPAHTSNAVPFDNKLIAATLMEINQNVSMLSLSVENFIDYTLTRIPPTPPNYQTIAELNKNGAHDGYVIADLEAGANRCAIS